jgi:hypothetical protein
MIQKHWKIFIASLFFFVFFISIFSRGSNALNLSNKFTETEKETILYSENAFYYYFYKEIALSNTISESFQNIKKSDKYTYPKKVDATYMFNIWQEVIIGILYKTLIPSKAVSPLRFYSYTVILIHALTPVFILLILYFLSGNILLSLLGPILYFLNIRYGTRVTHYIALRENLGIPLLLINIFFTLKFIKVKNRINIMGLFFSSFFHLLFWQFSGFTIFLKYLSIFASSAKEFSDDYKKTLRQLLFIDLVCYLILLFVYKNNPNYYLPMYLPFLLVALGFSFTKIKSYWINNLSIFLLGLITKFLLTSALDIGNDSHVLSIFIDKFLGKSSFFSTMYLHTGAFGFINIKQLTYFSKNLLLPLFIMGLISFLYRFIKDKTTDLQRTLWSIGLCFLVLSIIVNRLLVLSLPLIVILTVLEFTVFYKQFCEESDFKGKNNLILVSICSILILFFIIRMPILFKSKSFKLSQAKLSLISFLNKRIPKDSVIAADMALSSSLGLALDNRMIVHPQYEFKEFRGTHREFRRVYSYTSLKTVHTFMKSLKVDFIILEARTCRQSKKESTLVKAIHLDYPEETTRVFCRADFKDSSLFEEILRDKYFRILKMK